MFRGKQILAAALLCLLSVFGFTAEVHAGTQQSSSANYGVSEVNFGSGGDVHDCSSNYCAKTSAGELTVGNTKSSNYQAQAGFNTNREELLEVSLSNGTLVFGDINATTTRYGTASFTVRTYLASGYSVIVSGYAPTNKQGHTIAAPSTPTAPAVGTEQFGINLAANTSPATFGAAPVQVPDATFSFGAATSNYNTANKYMFVSGDSIASSNSSSGQTNYTISAIENVSSGTPAGLYAGHFDVIAVPTF